MYISNRTINSAKREAALFGDASIEEEHRYFHQSAVPFRSVSRRLSPKFNLVFFVVFFPS